MNQFPTWRLSVRFLIDCNSTFPKVMASNSENNYFLSQLSPFCREILGLNDAEISLTADQLIGLARSNVFFFHDSILKHLVSMILPPGLLNNMPYIRPVLSMLEEAICNGPSHDLSSYSQNDWQDARDQCENILQMYGYSLRSVWKRERMITLRAKALPLSFAVQYHNVNQIHRCSRITNGSESPIHYTIPSNYTVLAKNKLTHCLCRYSATGEKRAITTIQVYCGIDIDEILWCFSKAPNRSSLAQWTCPHFSGITQGLGLVKIFFMKEYYPCFNVRSIFPFQDIVLCLNVDLCEECDLDSLNSFINSLILAESLISEDFRAAMLKVRLDYFDTSKSISTENWSTLNDIYAKARLQEHFVADVLGAND